MIDLTSTQLLAAQYIDGPALIVSGAGAGKTAVLTQKVKMLIASYGFDPRTILCITFTNQAAKELKNRVAKACAIDDSKLPWVRTFHSACYKILKLHSHEIDLFTPLQVFNAYQKNKLLKDILLGKGHDPSHAEHIGAIVSLAKNCADPLGYLSKNPLVKNIMISDIYLEYEKALKRTNALDFDNILWFTHLLLAENEYVRKIYQNLFKAILCDEYQDSNTLQDKIIQMLLDPIDQRLFCAGDDWQAIFGFRGSSIENFIEFEKRYPRAKIFFLEQNFRSADNIVELANRAIEKNCSKMPKTCYSAILKGTIAYKIFENEFQEAAYWAKTIKSDIEKNPKKKVAVLYRIARYSKTMETMLQKEHICYQLIGGKSFFEREEIIDIHSFLLCSVYQMDDASLIRIINKPPKSIGTKTIQALLAGTDDKYLSLKQSLENITEIKSLTLKKIAALEKFINDINYISTLGPAKAIDYILSKIGYGTYLQTKYKTDNSIYIDKYRNIMKLRHQAEHYKTIEDYIEDFCLLDSETETETENSNVVFCTLHTSKGLEFDNVYMIGLNDGILPHNRVQSTRQMEEERRLLYVGITRAKSKLCLSSTNSALGQQFSASRFLTELFPMSIQSDDQH